MNNNLEFENEDPSPDSIEDNHPRTNYGEGYGGKETLEKAAHEYFRRGQLGFEKASDTEEAFLKGAKWMQERMYSEEDLKRVFEAGHKKGFSGYPNTENWKELPFEKWFEQFKKK